MWLSWASRALHVGAIALVKAGCSPTYHGGGNDNNDSNDKNDTNDKQEPAHCVPCIRFSAHLGFYAFE